MFSREARQHAQKVLIVISDKKSDSTDDEIDKAVTPLRENDVVIIPVAFGNEADKVQLVKLVDDESTLVTADTNNGTTDIKDEIMNQVFKGTWVKYPWRTFFSGLVSFPEECVVLSATYLDLEASFSCRVVSTHKNEQIAPECLSTQEYSRE